MLNPDVRHLMTDALRPPHGWRIDAAVATTYTLDLSSLLLAPLSMAAYDQVGSGVEGAAPHELLEAIRRYAERTVVMCQAGGIHVPSTYRKLTVFAEDTIIEVAPPPGRVFHPKIWVLRFTNPTGEFTHRLVCLSRNLTGDRSWDTVLSTDEDPDAAHQMPAGPVSGFLDQLLELSVREVPRPRADLVSDIARTLRDRSFAVPPPFTSGLLLPFGTRAGARWPMPAQADRSVVVSPFLDARTVQKMPAGTTIVSRPETFNRLGAAALSGFDTRVLQPHADAPPEDLDGDAEIDDPKDARPWEVKTGLHAKVLAWDLGRTGHLLTGSANATSAAFGGNIEFGVLLSGPASTCGAAAILKDDEKQTGFTRLLQPFQAATEPEPDPSFDIERDIEEFHIALAAALPVVTFSQTDGQYDARLDVARPEDPGQTWARPVTLKPQHDRPLMDSTSWRGLGHADITPFIAVRTRVERDGVVVERSSALRAELVGVPDDRAKRVLRELLSKVEDILRYLALLLRDPGIDDVASSLLEATNDAEGGSVWGSSWVDDLILLEPLVRAAAREDEAIDRVRALMDDLRDADGHLPDLGADFESLWHVVLASQEAM